MTSEEMPGAAGAKGGSRRHLIQYGVAAGAAIAGAGFAWWKFQPHAVEAGAAEALWGLSFDTPAGPALEMKSLRGRPLLVNFWATWCPPCVEELPLLDRFYKENSAKSWQVVGLAIDQPSAVRKFLQKTPVSFPVGMAGLGGTDLGKSLGNAAGGLPFTIVLSAKGDVLHRKMGQVSPADLERWARLG